MTCYKHVVPSIAKTTPVGHETNDIIPLTSCYVPMVNIISQLVGWWKLYSMNKTIIVLFIEYNFH